jgi:hypothetical protein
MSHSAWPFDWLQTGAGGKVTMLRREGGKHEWEQPGINTTSSVIAFFGLQ